MNRFKLIKANNFAILEKQVEDFVNEVTPGPRPILVHNVEDVNVTVSSVAIGPDINRVYVATIKYIDNRD